MDVLAGLVLLVIIVALCVGFGLAVGRIVAALLGSDRRDD